MNLTFNIQFIGATFIFFLRVNFKHNIQYDNHFQKSLTLHERVLPSSEPTIILIKQSNPKLTELLLLFESMLSIQQKILVTSKQAEILKNDFVRFQNEIQTNNVNEMSPFQRSLFSHYKKKYTEKRYELLKYRDEYFLKKHKINNLVNHLSSTQKIHFRDFLNDFKHTTDSPQLIHEINQLETQLFISNSDII